MDTSILDEIKKGNRAFLKKLYEENRRAFGRWARKYYNVSDDDAGEVYQKSFIAFYCNVKEGKLTELRSSVKTYLFSIGKNLLREQFKTTNKVAEPLDVVIEALDYTITEKYEQAHSTELIQQLLARIGDPCKTVLELYYFKDYSLEAIASVMNYKSEQIAAKRKFICLSQLRTLLKEQTT